MKKYILIAAVAFLTVVVASGAVLGYWYYNSKVMPVKAYENAAELVKDIKTANIDLVSQMKMEMTMKYMGESFDVDGDVKLTGNGDIDVENQKIKLDVNGETKMTANGESQSEQINMSEIVIGDDAYIKVDDGKFEKFSLDDLADKSGLAIEDFKNNQTWASLSDGTDYEYQGTEEIDGKKVYKYKVSIKNEDLEKLYNDLYDQLDDMDLGIEISEIDTKIEGVEMYVWVDQKTKEPVKEYVKINKLTLKFDGEMDIEMSVTDMVVSVVYDKINEPVNIEAPKL